MKSTLNCKMEKCNGRGKEWTMSIQTAEPYVEPPKDVDTELAISKFKN